MYWIYLIIFTLIVFVPTFIRDGFHTFDMTQTQEFTILFLGSLGFSLFVLQEKKLKKNIAEKSSIQGQVNNMSKDLKYSYTYIGEINRKLDILKHIVLSYPESSKLTHKNESELYDSIMEATRLFGKSDEFALRFACVSDFSLLKEIKSISSSPLGFSMKNNDFEKRYFESDDFIVIISPKPIDGTFSYIIMRKKSASQQIEDIELMKTLATQALFIFMLMRDKRKASCSI